MDKLCGYIFDLSNKQKTLVMKNLELTELEISVLKSLSNQDEYDELPTSSVENLSDETGISTKVIRGVLSSLVKKELVKTTTYVNGKTAFQFIYN